MNYNLFYLHVSSILITIFGYNLILYCFKTKFVSVLHITTSISKEIEDKGQTTVSYFSILIVLSCYFIQQGRNQSYVFAIKGQGICYKTIAGIQEEDVETKKAWLTTDLRQCR